MCLLSFPNHHSVIMYNKLRNFYLLTASQCKSISQLLSVDILIRKGLQSCSSQKLVNFFKQTGYRETITMGRVNYSHAAIS